MNMYYVWICELVGSWRVRLKSYNLSLNIWKTEVVELKSGVSIVVELNFGLPNYALYSYVIVGHVCNFDSWQNRSKNLVLTGNIKMR